MASRDAQTAALGLSVPGPAAFPCSNDSSCGTHKCNTRYGKCAWPCASDFDCRPGSVCFLASPQLATCVPTPSQQRQTAATQRDSRWDGLRESCDANDAGACFSLGALGLPGSKGQQSGVEPGEAEAALERACRLRHADACMSLVFALSPLAKQATPSKQLLRQDGAKSSVLAERACGLGDEAGCFMYGMSIRRGLLGAADEPRAIAIWVASCSRGGGESCEVLGEIFLERAKNDAARRTALDYFIKGCRFGQQNSCDYVNRIKH